MPRVSDYGLEAARLKDSCVSVETIGGAQSEATMTVEHWSGTARRLDPAAEGAAAVRPPLARLLAEAGVASEPDLRLAVAEGMATGERLGEVVLRRGWIDERRLAELLAEQWQLPFVAEPQLTEDPTRMLNPQAAKELAVCPIDVDADPPHFALAEPSEERLAAVADAVAKEPRFAVVTRSALVRLLDQLSETQSPADENTSDSGADDSGFEREAEAVVAGIEAAALAVSGLREKLAARTDEVQRELAVCHQELAELRQARAVDRATIDQLQTELDKQRELGARVRASLAELAQTLDGV
jgi:Type II secretion system (T2SS), protein E, N-terminal domain